MESPINRLQRTINKYASGQSELENTDTEGTAEYPPEDRDTDLAVNFAMKAAGKLDKNPREIAESLAEYLRNEADFLKSVSVAGPGFVNCEFSDRYLLELVESGSEHKFLPLSQHGEGQSVLLEFVSANPTGPLHVGHGRGAVYGDVLGRLLEAQGYEVTREYYVNDTGEQIRRLGESLQLRARELDGETVNFTDDHYRGDYVKDIVKKQSISAGTDVDTCAEIGIEAILEQIFEVLDRCDITFDTVTRETEIAPRQALDELIDSLRERGYIEDRDGAIFLLTSRHGDDKDRVLIKEDDTPTYFANDLLYHHRKFQRGFDQLIDVWGHDHHGYQDRVRAGLEFLDHDLDRFQIELYQLVDLYRDGEPVSMSTREGEFVPLDDLVDEVGVDAVRFNFLTKNHTSPLDFDIDVATSEDEENPVYYVQYAHTRLSSILREAPDELLEGTVDGELTDAGHDLLIKSLNYQHHIADATRSRDPHRVTHYLLELARSFHSYYGKHQVIDRDFPDRSRLRLRVVRFLKKLFHTTLNVLGVSAPERM
jgi:arginyl-tRNA synthetase